MVNRNVQSSRELPDKNARLVCFGIPRSGSTWVYQIACSLLGDGVVKTHDYLVVGQFQ